MTGLHCIMLVLETKAGNNLCSPSPVHIKFLVVARPVWTSDKGDTGDFWLGQEIPFIVGLFLEKKEN